MVLLQVVEAGYYSSSYVLGASPTSVSTISKLTYATETVETFPHSCWQVI